MRLRVHDDGRWALSTSPDLRLPWAILSPGFETVEAVGEDWFGPGWHEAVVLTATDADARRLAHAAVPELRHAAEAIQLHLADNARAVLDRLAAGTEGEW